MRIQQQRSHQLPSKFKTLRLHLNAKSTDGLFQKHPIINQKLSEIHPYSITESPLQTRLLIKLFPQNLHIQTYIFLSFVFCYHIIITIKRPENTKIYFGLISRKSKENPSRTNKTTKGIMLL